MLINQYKRDKDVVGLIPVVFRYFTNYEDEEVIEIGEHQYIYDEEDFKEYINGKTVKELKEIFENEISAMVDDYESLIEVRIYNL